MFDIQLHSNQKVWYRYLWPKRLTGPLSPAIYRWTFFVWSGLEVQRERREALKQDAARFRYLRKRAYLDGVSFNDEVYKSGALLAEAVDWAIEDERKMEEARDALLALNNRS